MQYQVSVGGTMYTMAKIFSVKIHQPLFASFSVGNTCSQELTVTFRQSVSPPTMAQIIPYYRESDTDEWTQAGVFYLDVRETDPSGKTILTAYDSMLKTEQPFNTPGDIGQWPRTMDVVANQIVTAIGCSLDTRTVISQYTMQYPNDYTMRDVLGYIAAANGGNWIVTAEDKFLLVPLFSSMPAETNYLVEEEGDAITFGGDRILV